MVRLCEQNKAEFCFGMEGQEAASPGNLPSFADSQPFHMASKCPFSGKSGGRCPFSGHSGSSSQGNSTSVAQGRVASPVQCDSSEPAAGAGQIHTAGRVLGSTLQRNL